MTSSSSLCVPWSFFTNCKTLLTERSWPVMRGFTHFHKLLARFYVVVPDSVTIGLKGVLFYGFLVVHRHVRCLSYWLSLSSDPPSLSGVVLLLISVYRSVSITNYLSINTFVSFLLFPSIFVTFRLSPSLVWKFFEFLSYQSEHFWFPWSDLVDWSSQNCFQLPGFHRSLLFCSVDCYPALFPVSPEVYYSSSWHQANLWRLWLRLLNPIKLDCWSLQWYSVSFSFLLCILPKVAGRLWFLVKLKTPMQLRCIQKSVNCETSRFTAVWTNKSGRANWKRGWRSFVILFGFVSNAVALSCKLRNRNILWNHFQFYFPVLSEDDDETNYTHNVTIWRSCPSRGEMGWLKCNSCAMCDSSSG